MKVFRVETDYQEGGWNHTSRKLKIWVPSRCRSHFTICTEKHKSCGLLQIWILFKGYMNWTILFQCFNLIIKDCYGWLASYTSNAQTLVKYYSLPFMSLSLHWTTSLICWSLFFLVSFQNQSQPVKLVCGGEARRWQTRLLLKGFFCVGSFDANFLFTTVFFVWHFSSDR